MSQCSLLLHFFFLQCTLNISQPNIPSCREGVLYFVQTRRTVWFPLFVVGLMCFAVQESVLAGERLLQPELSERTSSLLPAFVQSTSYRWAVRLGPEGKSWRAKQNREGEGYLQKKRKVRWMDRGSPDPFSRKRQTLDSTPNVYFMNRFASLQLMRTTRLRTEVSEIRLQAAERWTVRIA